MAEGARGASQEAQKEADVPMQQEADAAGSLVKLPSGRHAFQFGGRTIYEFEQSLEEVNLYIASPPGVKARHLECRITPRNLLLGIKGNKPFLDEEFSSIVVAEESVWTLADGEININLQKARKGETWRGVFQGHGAITDGAATDTQKQLMLERFQEEHPGFDFSGASFNGDVPDPRTFMGGIGRK